MDNLIHWITIDHLPAFTAREKHPEGMHALWQAAERAVRSIIPMLERNGTVVDLQTFQNEYIIIHMLQVSIPLRRTNYYDDPRRSLADRTCVTAWLQVITNSAIDDYRPHTLQFAIYNGVYTGANRIRPMSTYSAILDNALRLILYPFSGTPFRIRALLDANEHICYTQEFTGPSVRFVVYQRSAPNLTYLTAFELLAPLAVQNFTDPEPCRGTCRGANNVHQGDFTSFEQLTTLLSGILPTSAR